MLKNKLRSPSCDTASQKQCFPAEAALLVPSNGTPPKHNFLIVST